MNIPGHLAVALIGKRLFNLSNTYSTRENNQNIIFLFAGSFYPDMVDKPIGHIFHLMPNGRHFSHNVFSLMLTTLLVTLTQGKSAGYAWFIGYCGHLLADSKSFMPWFFPLKEYDFQKREWHIFQPIPVIKELIFLFVIAHQNRFCHEFHEFSRIKF